MYRGAVRGCDYGVKQEFEYGGQHDVTRLAIAGVKQLPDPARPTTAKRD